MSFLETCQMAVQNIFSSKMRSFLTMLGIIIGIAAVMVIIGLGNGMETYMTEQFQAIGANTLEVSIMGRGSSRNADEEDMYRIVADHPEDLSLISPTAMTRARQSVHSRFMGKTPSFFIRSAARRWGLVGRPSWPADSRTGCRWPPRCRRPGRWRTPWG